MLQANTVDLSNGIVIIENCAAQLRAMRNDASFETIWKKSYIINEEFQVVQSNEQADYVVPVEPIQPTLLTKRLSKFNYKHSDSVVMETLG